MATNVEPQAPPAAPDATDGKPSNQENEDPGAPGVLHSMFYEGISKIENHRTENLFESLEKRTLTDAEQAVIQERVAHQRKMFEEFERREQARKVRELKEVCPDITDDEASMALDMCRGLEDEAAAALTSDPSFLRRVKAACGTGPAVAVPTAGPSRQTRGGGAGRGAWSARPSGPRPKLVDPTTLGNSVFVGSFRGKGFQGASRGAKAPRAALPQQANNDSSSVEDPAFEAEREGEGGLEEAQQQQVEEEVREETPEAEQQVRADCGGAGSGASAPAGSPTHTEPQQFMLVAENSAGEMRHLTESEVARVIKVVKGDGTVAHVEEGGGGAGAGGVTTTTNAIKVSSAPDFEPAAPPPKRASQRRAAATAAAAAAALPRDNSGSLESVVAKLSCMDDEEAVAWLAGMAASAASAALQAFGSDNPERAVYLLEALDAAQHAQQDEQEEKDHAAGVQEEAMVDAPSLAHQQQEVAEEEKAAAVKPSEAEQTPKRAPKRPAAGEAAAEAPEPAAEGDEGEASEGGWDSEATVTEDPRAASGAGKEAPPTTAKSQPSSQRPQRAAAKAAVKAKSAENGDDADDSDFEPSSSRKKAGQERRETKRRKSSINNSLEAQMEAAAAAAAAGGDEDPTAAAAAGAAPMQVDAPTAGGGVLLSRRSTAAISSRGHTNRGRVKQKSHKSADLVDVGTLSTAKGWHNAGYIFPDGFQSRTLFRSSVALDQLCVHECFIVGKGGAHWPHPTFKVVALDRPDEPLVAKSCTGCWTQVLKRINAEIEARRRAGEDLPPPPKTAIAGPEYFGLNQPNITEAIEELDTERACTLYWSGKEDRQRAAAGLPASETAPKAPRAPRAGSGSGAGGSGPKRGGGRRRKNAGAGSGGISDEDGGHGSDGDNDETHYVSNRWSAIDRADRYRQRLQDNGEDITGMEVDPDNPLPDFIDPITLEPVVRPAISPYGHVMGAATWRAVLVESGKCPFTKQPLRWEQCRVLTLNNIEAYREKIIR